MKRLALLLVLLPIPLHAQEARYELGQRLRLFEAEWDRVSDAEARRRTLPHLKQATISFFTASPGEAGRGLDLARHALRRKETPADILWAESCAMSPARRFTDPNEVEVNLTRFYKPRSDRPEGVTFRVRLLKDGKSVVADVKELPLKLSLPLKDVKEGDHVLRGEIVHKDRVLASSEQTLSVVRNLKERLEKASKALKDCEDAAGTDVFTCRALLASLESIAGGKTPETNQPSARMLNEVEELLISIGKKQAYHGVSRPGQHRLSLAVKDKPVPVRVQVPEAAAKGKPLPLVIALHGAGGSENMFFDGYGNGAIAKLCAERGWLLATTQGGLRDGVVEELSRLYPVDPKKVFLIGHSMGAAQAVAAAGKSPEKYAAVAALGGSGLVKPSDDFKKVAFFVGVGKEDFALGGARTLHQNLKKAGVEKIVFKELDDIEHLVVVQVCLPDVFKLFDAVVGK